MKFCWLPALCFILFCACKKEIVYVIEDSTPEITLEISEVNDSSVSLSWNNITVRNIRSVKLYRQWETISDGRWEYVNEVLLDENNSNTTTFLDELTPYSGLTRYFVEVTTTEGNKLYSNGVNHYRNKDIFQSFIGNILVDTSENLLYTIGLDQGLIKVIDYTKGTIVATAQLDPFIGYCALGNFNNKKELYVPTNDGWLEIMDAGSLELKDRLYVQGLAVSSVVAHNGLLFISSSDRSESFIKTGALKVYDRATKQLISRAGYSTASRLMLFPGTDTHLAELGLNVAPTPLNSYSFDGGGALLEEREDSYHGDYMMEGNLVKASPDGKYFITSRKGNIFDSSLVYKRTVDDFSIFGYSDFEFSSDGSTIYAAKGMEPFIKLFDFTSLEPGQTLNTLLPPIKIFRDGNKLYSVSGDFPAGISGSSIPMQFIIESFNL
ncbi:MAG: fibronectin type III domain-containing protein [Chitinophagaceae bacterium]|nr:fibronectin type III domain-containing protein [Chitinophagaceae bacterium]